MKSRLKKVAIMSPDMFQGQLDQISDQGRNILKSIEEYKFFVEQASRVVKNDAKLTEVIINKKKNLDQAAQQIYDVVFEIENVDVIALYNEQQNSIDEQNQETENKPEDTSTENEDPTSTTPDNNEEKEDTKDTEEPKPEDSKDTKPEDNKSEEKSDDSKPEPKTGRRR